MWVKIWKKVQFREVGRMGPSTCSLNARSVLDVFDGAWAWVLESEFREKNFKSNLILIYLQLVRLHPSNFFFEQNYLPPNDMLWEKYRNKSLRLGDKCKVTCVVLHGCLAQKRYKQNRTICFYFFLSFRSKTKPHHPQST